MSAKPPTPTSCLCGAQNLDTLECRKYGALLHECAAALTRLQQERDKACELLKTTGGGYIPLDAVRIVIERNELQATVDRLTAALRAMVNVFDGQTEPLPPIAWQTELSQARAALAPVDPEGRHE